jgi:hypothetical protein
MVYIKMHFYNILLFIITNIYIFVIPQIFKLFINLS